MFWKSLIGALIIGSATTLSVIPTATAIATHSIKNVKSMKSEQTYDISFKEISTVNGSNFKIIPDTNRQFYMSSTDVIGATGLPNNFYNDKGIASLYPENQNVWDQVANVYGFNKNTDRFVISDIMSKNAIINVSITIVQGSYPFPHDAWVMKSFFASLKPKPPKDNIPLPDHTTDFSGNYKYPDIVKNLDYLMIKRQDFDKFDYSYLYWVPVFNFLYETQIDRNTTISVQGLSFKNVKLDLIIADETKFQPNRRFNIEVGDSKFILGIIDNSLVDFEVYYKGEKHVVQFVFNNISYYFQFFNDFLHVFFGNITYMKNNYNFLRYDTYLRTDFIGFMDYWLPKIYSWQGDSGWLLNYKNNNMYNSIYSVLGDFFYCMFYATFDMDPSTKVKVNFHSDSDSWKEKGYYFEIGFLYRSLITFYPKQYLFNGSYEGVNNHILFRSFYFLTDEKIHNDFISGKTNYYISFNVLKMYDNLMFNLPTSAGTSTINCFDANFDVQYGINIFTVSFPLLTTVTEKPQYTFYINDFNILNSTAFIPDNPDDSDNDLIPVPDCYASILSAGGWACILKQQAIRVINFLTRVTGLNFLLKPMVSIGQTVFDFFSGTFKVFHAVPAFQYLFTFLIGFSIFVIIFRFFI